MQDVTLDILESLNCPHCGEMYPNPLPEVFEDVTCPTCKEVSNIPGKFGQFLLFAREGESVTSVVFDAFDPKLGRNVTLKILNVILSKNPELVEAFKHEALAAAALNSTNVLKVYEFGIHNRQPFMVMEHIEGKFLHEVIQHEALSDHRILEITDGIVQGLEDMHDQGIMHGDVMPRNILIHTDGSPRISDFGLARFSGSSTGDSPRDQWESWSSPYYMPPERIEGGEEDSRGDFYSLGTTLYNMLTGELPFFDMDEQVILNRKLSENPPDPRDVKSSVHDGLAELCLMLMQRDPGDRPSGFLELRQLLAGLKQQMPRTDREIPEPELIPDYQQLHYKKKEPFAGFAFVVLLAILIAMIISLTYRKNNEELMDQDAAPEMGAQVPSSAPKSP